MGWSDEFATISSSMVTNAGNFLSDLSPVVAVLFGVAVIGMLVGLLARFVNR